MVLTRFFDGRTGNVRTSVLGIYLVLAVGTLATWLWAFLSLHTYPALLGTALLAYGFGLRHAVDADHIAAIDNVTRNPAVSARR